MTKPPFPEREIRKKAYEIYLLHKNLAENPEINWHEAIRQLTQEQSIKRRFSSQCKKVFLFLVSQLSIGIKRFISLLDKALLWSKRCLYNPAVHWLCHTENILRLLEVAGVIAVPIAVWWLSQSYQEQQNQRERERRRHEVTQNYFNQLTDILAEKKLRQDPDLQKLTGAITLSLLQSPELNRNESNRQWLWNSQGEQLELKNRSDEGYRKRQIIVFLADLGLIQSQLAPSQKPIISLRGANLDNVNLSSRTLVGHVLYQSELSKEAGSISLRGVNLSGAKLNNANLSGVDLKGADFSSSFTYQTIFNNADLTNANLSDAILINASFSYANLTGAKLLHANLTGANFDGANLTGVDLSYTYLDRSDLRYAQNLTKEQLNNAKMCETLLPEGINLDPNRHCSMFRRTQHRRK